jgi:hypothetical protein
MAASSIPYQRLPGRGTSLASYFSLYLGPGHLLLVSSTGFSESYKRFYFNDIQAVVVQRTGGWHVVSGIFGALSALCLAGWLLEARNGVFSGLAGLVFGSIVTVLCVVPLLANLVLGPTCACQIRTAVQTERLPTLKRLRSARKVLATLKPLIAAAQGTLSAEATQTLAPPAA